MATPPNWRNATGTQAPQLFTSVDGTTQVGVHVRTGYGLTVFKRTIATNSYTTYDMDADSTAISNGLVPLYSTEDANSVHYAYACAIDDQKRVWVVGNSLASTPHMMRSGTNYDISTWTSLPWNFPGFPLSGSGVSGTSGGGASSSTGGAFCTYNIFNRLSTGELLYHIDQRESSGAAEGKDNLAFILPLGTSSWVPLIGSSADQAHWGEFAISGATTPDRIYVNGCWVENYPHKDRVWVWGICRDDWTDTTTQNKPWIVYNDTVTNPATWKAVDGSSVSMPVNAATISGAAHEIPIAHGTYSSTQSGQFVVDKAGHPHVILREDNTTNWWHVWHTGSVWTSEQCNTSAFTPNLFLTRNGEVMMYRQFQGSILVSSILAGGPSWIQGTDVPSAAGVAYYMPFADPIQQQQYGNLHLLIGDGNTPRVWTYGDHAHMAAH